MNDLMASVSRCSNDEISTLHAEVHSIGPNVRMCVCYATFYPIFFLNCFDKKLFLNRQTPPLSCGFEFIPFFFLFPFCPFSPISTVDENVMLYPVCRTGLGQV